MRVCLPESGVDRAEHGVEVAEHVRLHATQRGEPFGGEAVLQIAQVLGSQCDIAHQIGGAGGVDRVHAGEERGCRAFCVLRRRPQAQQFGAKRDEPL